MSTILDIKHLQFQFSGSWVVYKVDDQVDLQKIKKCVEGTKDADIVGIYQNNYLYLIEVKDLRGHRIENKDKLRHGDMVKEFVQKIRDTIPAVVGAFHSTEHKEQWVPFMQKLGNRNEKIRVILWMEQDKDCKPDELSTLTKSIKQHLSWLTPRATVENQHTYQNNLNFSVQNLSR